MRRGAQLLLTRGSRVLLCRHARGPFAGRYTGVFAAAVRGDEAPQDALHRCAAELGLAVAPSAMQLRAIFLFSEVPGADGSPADAADAPCEEHQFVAQHDETAGGTPRATQQVEPAWWEQTALPYDQMPADDALWYPRVLAGELLRGSFCFSGRHMLSSELRRVARLP